MTEHPGVRHVQDAELTDYDRELIARIGAGWLPEFDPATARSGEAASAYEVTAVPDTYPDYSRCP